MEDKSSVFAGSIPIHYDRALGPYMFIDYAVGIAERAAALRPARVLEMAAGTGIVTRQLRDLLPASTRLTATDLTTPMLVMAGRKFGSGEQVDFGSANACLLPFEDGTFDCLVCQFGVMFFPDKDLSYREAHRVLAPGGAYLFCVWDSLEANSFAQLAHDTVAGFFDADPPQFFKLPFNYHDRDAIAAALISAGFKDVTVTDVALEKDLSSTELFARGLVLGTPVIEEIRERGMASPKEVVYAVEEALRAEFGEPGVMPLNAIIIEAKRE